MSDVPREDEGFLRAGRAARPGSRRAPTKCCRPFPQGQRRAFRRPRSSPPRQPSRNPRPHPQSTPRRRRPKRCRRFADVAALTPGADVARFVRPGVDGAVRQRGAEEAVQRSALQRHGRPRHLHRRLRQARSAAARDAAPDAPVGGARGCSRTRAMARRAGLRCSSRARLVRMVPSPRRWHSRFPSFPRPYETETRAEDDPDLRLQPDDADRRPGAGAGLDADGERRRDGPFAALPARGRRVPARRALERRPARRLHPGEPPLPRARAGDRGRAAAERAADTVRQHPRDRRLVEGLGRGACRRWPR